MTSIGVSNGSITVVNAMPCGIGATIGIDLETRAKFNEIGGNRDVEIVSDKSEDTTMASICVRRAYEVAGVEEPDTWSLQTESQIPTSRGLKSSSAACNAIIAAVFGEIGYETDPLSMIRLGVNCAREAKVTVTGSFDDACGCGLGGLVMTDNTADALIRREEIPTYDVVIHVPEFKIRKGSLPVEKLRESGSDIRRILGIVMKDPFRAMTLNGRIISSIQNVDNSLAEKALSMGALGAGMSGSGPAIAIVVPEGQGAAFAAEMDMDPKETILSQTR